MKVMVVGGGPAGMMAAGQAAMAGASVILLERNNRLGKKLAITGKGRGNLTNAAGIREFIGQFGKTGQFLYGPFSRFNNDDLRDFFQELGVPTVVERGGRVFPASQKAMHLVEALERFLKKTGVKVWYECRVKEIVTDGGRVAGVRLGKREEPCDALVLATGGASYPATGSTGDGYKLAEKLGHTILPLYPALVPLETEEEWVRGATGLALRNVSVTLRVDNRVVAEEFGEMLFTHYGVSGPVILTLSRQAAALLKEGKKPLLSINLKPALSPEQLDSRLIRDFEKYSRRQFKNSLSDLLPGKLIEPVVHLSGVNPELPVNQLTREQRQDLLSVIRGLALNVKRTRPLSEAIVTEGGVSTREIDPTTMESRICRKLYFAGEIIDIAGNTGGYNLQAAFSTGFVAGNSAAKE